MTDSDTYKLQWRGGKKGPWTLGEIHAALKSGDIHSLYQIEVDGQWQLLREFLDVLHVKQKEAARRTNMRHAQPTGIRKIDPRATPPECEQPCPPDDASLVRAPMMPESSLPPARNKTPTLYPIKGRAKHHLDASAAPVDGEYASDLTYSSFQRPEGGHMEWRHVGMAFLLLLSIVFGGIGSYAIVKMISAPAIQSRAYPTQ